MYLFFTGCRYGKLMAETFYTKQDTLRAAANLILAPLMWVLSSLGEIMPSARSAKEFSDMSENLLVPFGPAFAIWFPIFLLCIAYGIWSFLPKNRSFMVNRQAGWWTAAGFAGVCGWALITAFAPANLVQWASALIFIPAMLCLVKAMLIFGRYKSDLSDKAEVVTLLPISLIAGWTSLAIFLNWTPIAYNLMGTSVSLIIPSLVLLALALVWAIYNIRKTSGNLAYAFPVIWGLAFLAGRHLMVTQEAPTIGWAAIVGIALIFLALVFKRKPIEA